MTLDKEAYIPKGIRDANEKGIYIIHQELNMIPDMTITENLLLINSTSKICFFFLISPFRSFRIASSISAPISPISLVARRMQVMPGFEEDGYHLTNQLLQLADPPTAILAANNLTCIFRRARWWCKQGYSIPLDWLRIQLHESQLDWDEEGNYKGFLKISTISC